MLHPYTIFPLGDSALTIDFGNEISQEINDKVLTLYEKIRDEKIPYLTDLIPAYSSLTIHYDLYYFHQLHADEDETFFDLVARHVESFAGKIQIEKKQGRKKPFRIPVCYSEKFGLDLHQVANEKNISVEQIIELHTSKTYRVYMLGFLPGFTYMGEIDERLIISRKEQPRMNVGAGSIGIAGKQTGIYPLVCPGGWQLIGKTPLLMFDKQKPEPVLLKPGDEVEFYSITENELGNY